ncbi:hypothetical protein PG5_53790 [Pseudomonas sp. G5(2012)]|nr:hypothetical protein PG5_53790 [Pseudomonas sp. G5(2012)]
MGQAGTGGFAIIGAGLWRMTLGGFCYTFSARPLHGDTASCLLRSNV